METLITGVNCNGVIIPEQIVDIIHLVYTTIQWGVPLILIFVGMFDMAKAITQQKEDDIKKAQSLLVKKAIAALLVLIMFSLVSVVFGAITKSSDPAKQQENTDMWNCISNLIKGNSTDIPE